MKQRLNNLKVVRRIWSLSVSKFLSLSTFQIRTTYSQPIMIRDDDDIIKVPSIMGSVARYFPPRPSLLNRNNTVIEGETIDYFIPTSMKDLIYYCPVNPFKVLPIHEMDKKLSELYAIMENIKQDESFVLATIAVKEILKKEHENSQNISYRKIAARFPTR